MARVALTLSLFRTSMKRQKPTRMPYSCHAQFGRSGSSGWPNGGGNTVRGIGRSIDHSSTLTMVQHTTRASPGSLSCGRSTIAEYLTRSESFIERRHHLFGHQLERAPAEPGVDPVDTAVEQRAEIADRLAELEQLVDHLVHRPGDHEVTHHSIKGDRIIGRVFGLLEEIRPAGAHQLREELFVIEAIGTLLVEAVFLAGALVVVDEYR